MKKETNMSLPTVVMILSFLLAVAVIAMYVRRDISDTANAIDELKVARVELSQATKVVTEFRKENSDRVEAEDIRYAALKERIEKLEKAEQPVKIQFTEPVPIVWPKEFKGTKPPVDVYKPKLKARGSRATQ